MPTTDQDRAATPQETADAVNRMRRARHRDLPWIQRRLDMGHRPTARFLRHVEHDPPNTRFYGRRWADPD